MRHEKSYWKNQCSATGVPVFLFFTSTSAQKLNFWDYCAFQVKTFFSTLDIEGKMYLFNPSKDI